MTGASGAGRTGLSTLIELTAAAGAGDAFVVVALAGTIFFNTSVDQARGKVVLFLLVTMAPFAVLAPFIGPALDRVQQGRKYLLAGTLLARGLLCYAMSAAVSNPITLLPAAFGILVLQKAYGVVRASVAPRLLPEQITLVTANARSQLIAVITATVAAGVAAGIQVVGRRRLGAAGRAWSSTWPPWSWRCGCPTRWTPRRPRPRPRRPARPPRPPPTAGRRAGLTAGPRSGPIIFRTDRGHTPPNRTATRARLGDHRAGLRRPDAPGRRTRGGPAARGPGLVRVQGRHGVQAMADAGPGGSGGGRGDDRQRGAARLLRLHVLLLRVPAADRAFRRLQALRAGHAGGGRRGRQHRRDGRRILAPLPGPAADHVLRARRGAGGRGRLGLVLRPDRP